MRASLFLPRRYPPDQRRCAVTSPRSKLREHSVAEPVHVANRGIEALVRSVAEQADINRADAQLGQFLNVIHPIRISAGEHLRLAFDGAARPRPGASEHSQSNRDLLRVAPGFLCKAMHAG